MAYIHGKDDFMIALKGDSAFIRYSAHADGTDFTEEWSEGQNYIGFAVGQTAPTDKSGYTWGAFDNSAKLDKVTTTGAQRAYAISVDGRQIVIPISIGITNNASLVLRNGNGNAFIATPTDDNHIANKQYVDDKSVKVNDTTIKVGNTELTEATLLKLIDLTITKYTVHIVNDTEYLLICTVDGKEVASVDSCDCVDLTLNEGTQINCKFDGNIPAVDYHSHGDFWDYWSEDDGSVTVVITNDGKFDFT